MKLPETKFDIGMEVFRIEQNGSLTRCVVDGVSMAMEPARGSTKPTIKEDYHMIGNGVNS